MQKKKSAHNAHVNNANDTENGHRSRRANIPDSLLFSKRFSFADLNVK